MEEEKKKKKNKKKRGKQTKTSEDVAVNGETAPPEQSIVADQKQNLHVRVSGNAVVQNVGTSELDAEMNCHQVIEEKCVNSTVLLEEEVRQLESEKESWLQRENHLEDQIEIDILDKRSWISKEISLEEKIMQLQNEKDCSIQMEANLKEKIKHLQKEIDSRGKKEFDFNTAIFTGASLEEIIKLLRREKDLWAVKEVDFEEKIKLLEGGKDSWIVKENSSKEMIAGLNDANLGLQMKVKELEESRNGLLQENQRLVESMSRLELQIQHLEREGFVSSTAETTKHVTDEEDPNSMVEAARDLVEKLIFENAELVEKVNELYVELDRHAIRATQSSMIGYNPATVMARTATDPGYLLERGEETPRTIEAMQFPAHIQNGETVNVVNNTDLQCNVDETMQKDVLPGSFKTSETTSDIVEVPLDENDIQEVEIKRERLEENNIWDVESQSLKAGEDDGVPFSDAPLIGAPFRLISFVASYVTGADLVGKNSLGSGG
ncbi:zygote defective protein 12 isoform X2 [Cinnamomum micranthum f. kanehirae]|uniref:Zygote defective protein 12 isoform X2 n=1 Tax=Cinnamomum micranthum f. kanehirae TaxID=337451 RepID=A0A3S3P0Y5_9MAGN|nr:zygote defective protein 12 isoform X2 [Cinnamomum micranthum f. kanehirae]